MQPDVSIANRELVLRIPSDGVDPSWIGRRVWAFQLVGSLALLGLSRAALASR